MRSGATAAVVGPDLSWKWSAEIVGKPVVYINAGRN